MVARAAPPNCSKTKCTREYRIGQERRANVSLNVYGEYMEWLMIERVNLALPALPPHPCLGTKRDRPIVYLQRYATKVLECS